jgi:protein SCO1/2
MVLLGVLGVFITATVRSRQAPLPIYGDVSSFTLTNQLGQPVSLSDLKGDIWVADIIFTRCPGPCLQMTRQLQTIRSKLPEDSRIKFVSLTADPQFDTPQVLAAYAARFNADPNRWLFLTGPKEDIYPLAMQGLKLAVEENLEGKSLAEQFIHSTRFVVVDRRGQLRGFSSDGTQPAAVSEVVRLVKRLRREST